MLLCPYDMDEMLYFGHEHQAAKDTVGNNICYGVKCHDMII